MVQNFNDNFDKTLYYDDFINYWASWSAREITGSFMEVYSKLEGRV